MEENWKATKEELDAGKDTADEPRESDWKGRKFMAQKTNKNIDKLLLEKCMTWLDYSTDKDHVSLMHAEDVETYHQRIYLIAWSDDDGYAHIYALRVFTADDGRTINLSEDYEDCVGNDEFIDVLPFVIQKINELKA